MKNILFMAGASLCVALLLCGCTTDQVTTSVVLYKNVPFDGPVSYCSIWQKETEENKQKVIAAIDARISGDGTLYNAVRDEWSRLDFRQKDEYIEDFFFRRKSELAQPVDAEKQYRDYLGAYLADDFTGEFVTIMLLSPEVKSRVEQEKEASYRENAVPAPGGELPSAEAAAVPQGTAPRSIDSDVTQQYEKAAGDAGLTPDAGEEDFVQDVTKEIKE
jgi:hypothetical protein